MRLRAGSKRARLTEWKSRAGFADVQEEQQGNDDVGYSINPLNDEHDE